MPTLLFPSYHMIGKMVLKRVKAKESRINQRLRAFHIKHISEVMCQISCKNNGLVYDGGQEGNSEPDMESIRRVVEIKQV